MSNQTTTYDVRIHNIDCYGTGRNLKHRVRWSVAGSRKSKSFSTAKLADSFRSTLLTAARQGELFDVESGLPASQARELNRQSWYQHACKYVDTKWPYISPGHREGISETLTIATLALLKSQRGKPSDDALRAVLHGWAFSKTARGGLPAPEATAPIGMAQAVRWLAENTVDLSEVSEPETIRRVLDSLALKRDGKAVAASTINRRRSTLYSALQYGVELKHFAANPIDGIKWAAPKQDDRVDPRVLANPEQIGRLLEACDEIYPSLTAYYGCMYFAAMRPAEVRHLSERHLIDILDGEDEADDVWGELLLDGSTQQTGRRWNDDGASRQERSLKHRAENSTRRVPANPPLRGLLRRHVNTFGFGPNGILFVTRTGPFGRIIPLREYSNPVHPNTVSRTWDKVREKALTKAEYASPLAKRPYDLRHAGVSLQLNAGVPATRVAEWAGHSVKVLLQVYAGCIAGEEEAAKRRLEAALSVHQWGAA